MSQPNANETRPAWSSYFSPRMLLATLATFALLTFGLSPDTTAWKLAQAERYRSEPTKSLQFVDEVLAASPKNIDALEMRIALLIRLGDKAAAIRTASDALAIPKIPANDRIEFLLQRAELRQQLGQHIEAIRDANEALSIADGLAPLDERGKQRALVQLRNARAYSIARAAVAGKANRALVASAQRDMQQVFLGLEQLRKETKPSNSPAMLQLWYSEAQYLDTSAYLALAAGDLPTALRDFSRVMQLLDAIDLMLQREATNLPRESLDQYRSSLPDTRAVVLHHRGEVLLAMGNQEQGAVSIALAKRLGYDPARGNW